MKYLRVQELVSQACREIEYLEWLYSTMTTENHSKYVQIYKNRIKSTNELLHEIHKETTLLPEEVQTNVLKARHALIEGLWLISNEFNKLSHDLYKLEANNEILSLILDNK